MIGRTPSLLEVLFPQAALQVLYVAVMGKRTHQCFRSRFPTQR